MPDGWSNETEGPSGENVLTIRPKNELGKTGRRSPVKDETSSTNGQSMEHDKDENIADFWVDESGLAIELLEDCAIAHPVDYVVQKHT